MKIGHSYKLYAVTSILLLLIMGIVVFQALNIQDDVVRSEGHRFRSFLLAVELFQSSEDLTRMARSYVTTGNPIYEKRYFEILDIRNGKQPRPDHYTATYWHLAGVGKGPAIAHGEAVALQDLMRREGLTEQEFTLLRESQANSDRLVLMEKQAFAAMKGLYDDGQGNFTVKGAPDRDYAIRLVFSEEYLDEKAKIMAPIQQFTDVLDKRTNAELKAHESTLRRYILLALVLIVIAMFGVVTRFIHTQRKILQPIEQLRSQVAEIALGNYAARCDILSVNEIGELCVHFNSMADSLETDILRRQKAEETLKKSEEQVRLLLNSTAEAIYGIDLRGNCTFANPSCLRMLGYADTEQLLGKNMHLLIHHSYPDGSPMTIEDCSIYRAFREGAGVHRDDEVLWKEDGASFPVEYWSYPQVLNGGVSGAVVTFIDITKRKQAEQALATERQRLSYILEGTNVGTWEWNVQTGETIFNERWAEIIGYTLAEIAPVSIDTWMKFSHPDDFEVSRDLLAKHFNKVLSYYECEVRMRHKNGSWIWVLDRGKVATWTSDGKPLVMCGTHQDITERKLAEEKIRHMATHDVLTDLPTLRLAKDRLSMALGTARRHKSLTAVMFIDLDDFKAVNDAHGHAAGNHVLREVAKRLLSSVRETDTVSRVGGDEFLLIATELHSLDDAARIAEKAIRLVSQPVILDNDRQATVGASIGIALYPNHGDDIDQLIKQADETMYRIKNSGKNGFGFSNLK